MEWAVSMKSNEKERERENERGWCEKAGERENTLVHVWFIPSSRWRRHHLYSFAFIFILDSSCLHMPVTTILILFWPCDVPITGSYKNWPRATAEDDALRPGGGVLFYFIHLFISFLYFFFTARLKGSPGQDAVKGGDNDVCPHTEGHTNIHTYAVTHIFYGHAHIT